MSNVATVHIVKNQLGVAHVSALCSPSSLDTRPSPKLPTILQLDGNPLRPEGARILSCAMRNQSSIWCSLSTLRLGYCQLAAAGSHLPQRVCKITTSSHPPARWWTHRILPAGMVILPAQEWAAGGNAIAAMHTPARSIHQRLPGAAAGAMDKTVWGCGLGRGSDLHLAVFEHHNHLVRGRRHGHLDGAARQQHTCCFGAAGKQHVIGRGSSYGSALNVALFFARGRFNLSAGSVCCETDPAKAVRASCASSFH